MIKNIKKYWEVKNFMIDNHMTTKQFLNISHLAKNLNMKYSTAYKYANVVLEELNKE